MQFLSYYFIILWAVAFALYYLLPWKMQPYVLLMSSILFYAVGLKAFPFALLITAVTTWGCAIYLKKSFNAQKAELEQCADKEQKKSVKSVFEKKRKTLQILYFIINLGMLALCKYTEGILMPLGISFYTLTAMSYVIDVGRENCEAETDFCKVLLFLAYFPAITQGPFQRFSHLKEQTTKEHTFDYNQMLRGIQRFIWGAFKKLVIADRIAIFVNHVFQSDAAAVSGSIYACAVVLYMLQLYADFSGYIDMAAGVSETFDIALPENFKRPYFAKSVAEFWRRWHVTLGAWFKDYVMFSFVMSVPGRKLGKFCKKKWSQRGKHVVPIIGTMLVWIFTGVWHDKTINYMLWGVYYGLIMSLSLVLESRYPVWKQKFHIKEGKGYQLFCMVRTWAIVFAADVLIRSESLAQAGAVFAAFFTRFHVKTLLSSALTSYGLSKYEFLMLFAVLFIWLFVSILEEHGKDVRACLAAKPVLIRWSCYYGIVLLLLITGIYGGSYDTAVFLYQSF